MSDDAPQTGKAWPFVMSWTGRLSAMIGLGASLIGGATWVVKHHRDQTERRTALALARSEAAQSQFAASIGTYDSILQNDPLNAAALEGELNATMLWVENFNATDASSAAPSLDHILVILAGALNRAKGPRAADIQSHLGWAHWLNQRIAAREFGPAAEQNFRAALAADPHNVYANAMLGNWTLQTGVSVPDAVRMFDTAVATGQARPFVRRLQIGGLLSRDAPGARAALMVAANDIRSHQEPLDPDLQHRLLNFCCDPALNNHAELTESLSAVSGNDAWATCTWLDGPPSDPDAVHLQALRHAFLRASLTEIAGDKSQALAQYRQLHQQLAQQPGSLLDAVNASIARLTHPA